VDFCNNGILVAVKEFSEGAVEEAEAQAEFEKEIQILSQISSHPNVVILVVRSRLQSVWRVMCVCHLSAFKGATIQPRCIVMEFVENGSLLDVIRKRPNELTEVRSFTILKGVAAGMVMESHYTRSC
jgi:serine/threonine protein kinase